MEQSTLFDSHHKGKLVTSFGGGDVDSSKTGKARFATVMVREEDDVVQARRLRGTEPVVKSTQLRPLASWKALSPVLYHPQRPSWSTSLSAKEIDDSEQEYFSKWVKTIYDHYEPASLTPFEHNLEVWRQLWRVIEQSDVILLTADCRNPLFHISQSLVHELMSSNKPLVIVMTKTDLVSQQHVEKWTAFLKKVFPFAVISPFSSRGPLSESDQNKLKGGVSSRRKVLKVKPKYERAKSYLEYLLNVCTERTGIDYSVAVDTSDKPLVHGKSKATPAYKRKYNLSIGILGHPNTGKTSLLNALVGRKVASVSKTAGHTKYLQHIPLDGAYDGVCLIDCPGLIFPLEQPRFMGELLGLYPIAQVREPYSAIRYAFEYLPLVKLYIVTKPDWYEEEDEWNPVMFCEALAEKKGYLLAQGGAPDNMRAGLEVLRDICDGIVALCFEPPVNAVPISEMKAVPHTLEVESIVGESTAPGEDMEEREQYNTNSRYREEGYWDRRFKTESEYEWLCGFHDVAEMLMRDVRREQSIMILGCGNSPFSAQLADAGFSNITSVDYSATVVKNMREKYAVTHPGLKWEKSDVRDLHEFDDRTFDVVVDKACFDALVCDEGDPWHPNERTVADMTAAVRATSRVLKNTGTFISIGFQQPHFRKRYLKLESDCFGWENNMQTFPIDVGLGYFYTRCKKSKT
jgi:ribosome biogenesis GTPase A/SAM-dependent methyltransferase